jgi:nucleosome assembly protein 1-like 1
VKGIPNFWLSVFQHHDDFADSITDQDEKALKHLIDVRWKPIPVEKGRSESSFVLEFEFTENSYFTNKILTKSFYFTEHEIFGDIIDNMEA